MPDHHPAAQIEAHIPGLRRFARQLLRGDPERADDLVQDTLERALSRWHLRRNDGDMHGWLYTILYHRFLTDLHREKRRNAHHGSTDMAVDRPEVEGEQEAALVHRDLLRAFAELPEEQRSVLFLVTVEDLSYGEAARILGVPIGTVMSRLSRGRDFLRRLRRRRRLDCARFDILASCTRFGARRGDDHGRRARGTPNLRRRGPSSGRG